MSVYDELERLNPIKGKVDKETIRKVLDDAVNEYMRTKSVKEAIVVAYLENAQTVKANREAFDIIAKVLEDLAKKIGFEYAVSVIVEAL